VIAVATGVTAAALSVSPVHLRLDGMATRVITIRNTGSSAAIVDAQSASIRFDRRGRPSPAAQRRQAGGWLRLRPRRLVVDPGASAVVTVWSVAPNRALPGDHAALVLLTTAPSRATGIAVRLRVGVVVLVRVAGRIVHRLELGSLKARRRVLVATVVNRGNVAELSRVRISLSRGGHVLARLRSSRRTVLPHSRSVERFRYHGRVRGWVTALVEVGAVRRVVRIRL
jgi:hypothetical protein